MDEVPHTVLRMMTEYLTVRECLSLELAVHLKLNKKDYYVERFKWEPISNTFRFFKKNVLRTYKIYSYVDNGITYSDVSVSPICRTFQCKHKRRITPSDASHWVVSCVSEGNNKGCAYIEANPVRLFITTM